MSGLLNRLNPFDKIKGVGVGQDCNNDKNLCKGQNVYCDKDGKCSNLNISQLDQQNKSIKLTNEDINSKLKMLNESGKMLNLNDMKKSIDNNNNKLDSLYRNELQDIQDETTVLNNYIDDVDNINEKDIKEKEIFFTEVYLKEQDIYLKRDRISKILKYLIIFLILLLVIIIGYFIYIKSLFKNSITNNNNNNNNNNRNNNKPRNRKNMSRLNRLLAKHD